MFETIFYCQQSNRKTKKDGICMKGFTKSETKLLLSEAVKARSVGNSMSKVFAFVAEKTGRAKGSVRNYYYNFIKDESKKREFSKSVKGVEDLKATKFENFSDGEVDLLLNEIRSGKAEGKSVRSVLKTISGGDEKLALRFQNKYRNYLKKTTAPETNGFTISDDYSYFDKLSREIDALVDKIKDKYAVECVKLKKENEKLERENKALKKRLPKSNVQSFFMTEKKHTN